MVDITIVDGCSWVYQPTNMTGEPHPVMERDWVFFIPPADLRPHHTATDVSCQVTEQFMSAYAARICRDPLNLNKDIFSHPQIDGTVFDPNPQLLFHPFGDDYNKDVWISGFRFVVSGLWRSVSQCSARSFSHGLDACYIRVRLYIHMVYIYIYYT